MTQVALNYAVPNGLRELTSDEIEAVSGGGFFEDLGWIFDNPGTACGRGIDRFLAWYRISPDEDPRWFIGS